MVVWPKDDRVIPKTFEELDKVPGEGVIVVDDDGLVVPIHD